MDHSMLSENTIRCIVNDLEKNIYALRMDNAKLKDRVRNLEEDRPDIKSDALAVAGDFYHETGKKILAIKIYRRLTKAGLKEAKEAVEIFWDNK